MHRSNSNARRIADLTEPRLRMVTFACTPVADVEPQALGFTYWFDAAESGEPYPVTIRFTGHRIGVKGKLASSDKFDVLETVQRVVPGSGPIAVTTRVTGVTPGEWKVNANPTIEPHRKAARPRSAQQRGPDLSNASSTGRTGFAPAIQIRAPGAHTGAWPSLVGLGAAIALVVQAVVASHFHLNVTRVLAVSLAASVVGLVGGKLYYVLGHLVSGRSFGGRHLPGHRTASKREMFEGNCIQGFVLGAISVLVLGASATGVSVGRLLDLSTPALLFGMVVGRFGCFFGGCCAGKATASRWGLWSSDRRLGMFRIPTQLMESLLALVLGLAALRIVWTTSLRPAGVVFVGAMAAYTLGRQFLFALRDQSRHTSHGRIRMMTITGLVIVADVVVAVLH